NQTLTTITLTPATVSLAYNATQTFTASAADQFGTALATQPTCTWSVSSGLGTVSAAGLYTAPASGTGGATVRATSGAVFGTATVSFTNAAPTVATVASATPNPVTDKTTVLSVLGADDGGEGGLTYAWATTGTVPAAVSFSVNGSNAAKITTATFTKSGTYGFQVTIADAHGATALSLVTVTVSQRPGKIKLNPGMATLEPGSSQAFSAMVEDQFGEDLATQPPCTWNLSSGLGGINGAGLYSAPSVAGGSAVVMASAAGLSATAPIQITGGVVVTVGDGGGGGGPTCGAGGLAGLITAGLAFLTLRRRRP
ncbi:MAG TPA: hypothetical protein DCS97_04315, partial [Planctomycetes bacterium]|nr:hypothetical protein [Planctomycetota bacterium]